MSRGFRVWDIENEEYRNGNDVLLRCDGSAISRYALEALDTDMPVNVIIEQDTGIEDKNGKRICEGDVVREKWYDNDVNRGRDRIGKIEYFCDRFVCWFGGTFVNLGMFPSENIEIIGNIHENKELLEDEK